jgi:hypothetical protein
VKTARGLIIAGSVILFVTALLHGSGYPKLGAEMASSNARPLLVSAFKALWLVFSAHLIVLSLIFVTASRIPGGKRIVLIGLLIPAFDVVLLFHFLGLLFIGTISVALAGVLLLAGGLMLPNGSQV